MFFLLYFELLFFENYIFDYWIGICEDFISYICEQDRYWIIDDINYIDKIFNEKENKGNVKR